MKRRITLLGLVLAGFNLACWLWAWGMFRDHPALLGTALLAYGFGLRHAVDADHIAAIDNATRKLIQDGQRPLGVGLYFSLGHSSVVVLLSLALAFTATAFERHFGVLKAAGDVAGSMISAVVLLALGLANLITLPELWRRFRAGGEDSGPRSGLMGMLLRRVFALIGRSWHLFPLGFLFGLGFDTATEIGVLGVSAANAANGLPIWSILVFPALFSAGMALLDTADGILMLGAYGWAFIEPRKKLYYNLCITLISALAALLVGALEALGLVGDRLGLTGGVWSAVATINGQFGLLGVALVGLFAFGWMGSLIFYRISGYAPADQ
jgi:high-affinity nickel-transport protein